MSKLIQLTRGKVAIVDDEDFESLNKFRWYCDRKYAAREVTRDGIRERIYMHRLIINAPDHLEVDHINGDGADNRKENLRLCTHSQNVSNRKTPKHNTVGYKGVYKHSQTGKYVAEVRSKGIKYCLGCHSTPEEAYEEYKKKVFELHGEFANLLPSDAVTSLDRGLISDFVPQRSPCSYNNKIGYTGITLISSGNRFQATICFGGESISLGSFLSLHEAVRAYNKKSIELYGNDTKINIIKEGEKDIVFENKAKTVYLIPGYVGIKHNKSRKKFIAQFNSKYIGVYPTIQEAIQAYNNKAKEIRGEKAVLNPMPSTDN